MAGERGDQDNGGAWFHRERGGQVPQTAERGDADAISGLWRKCDGCAEYVRTETLALELQHAAAPADAQTVAEDVNGERLRLGLRRA